MSTTTEALEALAVGTFEAAYHAPATPEDLQKAIQSHLRSLPSVDTATALWMLDGYVKNLKTAASAVQAAIDQLRIDDIRQNGAVRLGDQAFVITPDNDRKLLVPIEDFLEFLSIQGWPLDEVFSLSERNVRITAFRTWAERSYREYLEADGEHYQLLDEDGQLDTAKLEEMVDGYVRTIEDTFFEKVEKESARGKWKLKGLPLKEAQWAQLLDHGQRRPPKISKGS